MRGRRRATLSPLRSPIRARKPPSVSFVQVSTLDTLSVLGQRGLPVGLRRLLLLKAVGSRPARRAKPEADNPCLAARRSIARQISEWRSMFLLSRRPRLMSADFVSGVGRAAVTDCSPLLGWGSAAIRQVPGRRGDTGM